MFFGLLVLWEYYYILSPFFIPRYSPPPQPSFAAEPILSHLIPCLHYGSYPFHMPMSRCCAHTTYAVLEPNPSHLHRSPFLYTHLTSFTPEQHDVVLVLRCLSHSLVSSCSIYARARFLADGIISLPKRHNRTASHLIEMYYCVFTWLKKVLSGATTRLALPAWPHPSTPPFAVSFRFLNPSPPSTRL